jgi:anti-repressor protein
MTDESTEVDVRQPDTQTFQFGDAHYAVRIVTIGDEPWFVATDVARVLGCRDAANVTRLLKPHQRRTHRMSTSQGERRFGIISESGLYQSILQRQTGRMTDGGLRSRIDCFQTWVTEDVLPSIRATGSYVTEAPQFELPQTYAAALRALADTVEDRDRIAGELSDAAPKVALVDALIDVAGDYSVAETAKVLARDYGIETGRNRLFTFMREIGWIDYRGEPYQDQINAGRLTTRIQTYTHPHTGEPTLATPQIRVTPKGVVELHYHFKSRETGEHVMDLRRVHRFKLRHEAILPKGQ